MVRITVPGIYATHKGWTVLDYEWCYLREGFEALGGVRSMLEGGRSSLLCNLSSSLSSLS